MLEQKKKDTYVTLYRATNEDTPENQVEWVDKEGKIYNSTFTFRKDTHIEKEIAEFFERKILYEEKEWNRYQLLMDECLIDTNWCSMKTNIMKRAIHQKNIVVRRKKRS